MKQKEKQRKLNIFKRANIKQQLYSIYFVAIVLPITIIGCFLVVNTSKLLTSYHRDLLESDNLRVKTILFEITTQIYNISEELTFDEGLREMLSHSYYLRANLEKRRWKSQCLTITVIIMRK